LLIENAQFVAEYWALEKRSKTQESWARMGVGVAKVIVRAEEDARMIQDGTLSTRGWGEGRVFPPGCGGKGQKLDSHQDTLRVKRYLLGLRQNRGFEIQLRLSPKSYVNVFGGETFGR
jgi:hypothetical protein